MKTAKISTKTRLTQPQKAHRPAPRGPGKTFQKDGHWIENPNKPTVLLCICGNRYLKTRHAQTKCLRCISQGK